MKKMLVLLDRPEDIDSHLAGLTEITKIHGVAKVYLARISCTFGSRARSVVAPHKLDMALRMSDAAASQYFLTITDDLRTDDVDVEPVRAGISFVEIDKFIQRNEIDLIVTSDGRSGLCRWLGADLPGRHVLFLCDHVFGLTQPIPQEQPHGDKRRGQKQRPERTNYREKDAK